MPDLPEADEHPDTHGPKYALNWDHFVEAYSLYNGFMEEHFSEELRIHRENSGYRLVPLNEIKVAEENKRVPRDGYLSFYSDLLGFSAEVITTRADSLPDFYGAALFAAKENPKVQVFLLSDSCLAFAHRADAGEFLAFANSAFGSWRADGMRPQCFIGYGSFAVRRPFSEATPPNFFGTQVAGTALVDAVSIQKSHKPLGSRMLVSELAAPNLPKDVCLTTDPSGKQELFSDPAKHSSLFDCIYYLLCLRSQVRGSRAFRHYVWSAASRTVGSGYIVLKVAQKLVAPHFDKPVLDAVVRSIIRVTKQYKSIQGLTTGRC